MSIEEVEFVELEKKVVSTGKSVLNCLAPDVGKVHVVTITRDSCSACMKQKPKIEKLARNIQGEHVIFSRVHINFSPDFEEESLRSKDVFGHYFYPTNLVLLRTVDKGVFEFYRCVSPTMKELERNIKRASNVASMLAEMQ
jgi:thiol-disulfide isomerase/thioredoxin